MHGDASIYIPVQDWDHAANLPSEWQSPAGWQFAKRLILSNTTELDRHLEPIEVDVDFHGRHITDLESEVRVAATTSGGGGGRLEGIPSQVHLFAQEDSTLRCRLFFLASVPRDSTRTYVVLYGNPDAPAPIHDTDLSFSDEDYPLEVENAHYRATLSHLSGNWKCHFPKGWEATLDSGGGHGVEGTIHWGPDWSEERVGRYRITSWDGPQMFEYDVIRGPVCLRLRRRGHPILSLGPTVGRPHKVMATVTYSFWAGQPYVIMESKLDVFEDVRFRDCRNDEFVIGEQLPERAWMAPDGEIGIGAVGWDKADPGWMSYFNPETGEGFGSVHLEFENTNPNFTEPDGSGFSRTGVWVRSPVHHANMQAGDHVYEKNAYVAYHFDEHADHGGFAELVERQQRLLNPLTQVELTPIPQAVTTESVLDALRGTNEFELYLEGSPWGQRQLSFIDIGIVSRVHVDGNDVQIDLVMPYAGRETWFDWFSDRIREQFEARLGGVGRVEIQLVHDPAWSPEQMTDRARRAIGSADD
jgi:metal-sulfur cluster biosynthetic enzyme